MNATNSTLGTAKSALRAAAVSCLQSFQSLDITTNSLADSEIAHKIGHEGAPVTTLRWLDVKFIAVEESSCPELSGQDKILRWAAAMLHDVTATYSIMATGVRC